MDNDTPIHIATTYNNLEMMDMLITNGANIEAENFYEIKPIHIAAMRGHY